MAQLRSWKTLHPDPGFRAFLKDRLDRMPEDGAFGPSFTIIPGTKVYGIDFYGGTSLCQSLTAFVRGRPSIHLSAPPNYGDCGDVGALYALGRVGRQPVYVETLQNMHNFDSVQRITPLKGRRWGATCEVQRHATPQYHLLKAKLAKDVALGDFPGFAVQFTVAHGTEPHPKTFKPGPAPSTADALARAWAQARLKPDVRPTLDGFTAISDSADWYPVNIGGHGYMALLQHPRGYHAVDQPDYNLFVFDLRQRRLVPVAQASISVTAGAPAAPVVKDEAPMPPKLTR